MLCCDAVRGGGAEREQWWPLRSPPDLVTPSATHNQIGPLWRWLPSGRALACPSACPRPLWVSPTTSPVRLGVSPAAAPTPTGVFNPRVEALFPRAGAGVARSASLPALGPGLSVHECGAEGCYPPLCLPRSLPLLSPALSVYLCANVGLQGVLVV